MSIYVPPITIVIYSDLLDPFAHVAVHRLFTTRARLDLEDIVRCDHHAFPLELINGPGTRLGSASEIPALGSLEPDAGWQLWHAPDWHCPNTVLLAFEAIPAAKQQSTSASENLDRALRHAFWAESRCIGHHGVILEIAREVKDLDAEQLDEALRRGTARQAVFDDLAVARSDDVAMSPHLFGADATSLANPGIAVHWQGDWAKGFPVIDRDDPSVYDALLVAASRTVKT